MQKTQDVMQVLQDWKTVNPISQTVWDEQKDQLAMCADRIRFLSAKICDRKDEAVKHRKKIAKKHELIRHLESQKHEYIKVAVDCPTVCTDERCVFQKSSQANFEVELDAPVLQEGAIIAHIYDGCHNSVDLLTHDAQGCEYLIDAYDGTWHRSRPVMPASETREMHSAAHKMLKATEMVDSHIGAFSGNQTSCYHSTEMSQHRDREEHSHIVSGGRHKSVMHVSSFLQDRHGHRSPTSQGTHA